MEFGLGRFGDRRLEKGGPPCMLLLLSGRALGSDGSGDVVQGRCVSPASCIIPR
jgi:hypothetical protein